MRSFSKLIFTLLLIFTLSLFCLTATILILLRRRRRRLQPPLAGDAEIGCKGASFNFLCCAIQSRVEPTGDSPGLCASGSPQVKIPEAVVEVEVEVEVAFGRSRVLYTIEEEEREGLEIEEKEEEDLFTTPCESPAAFYTPASSPLRAAVGGGGEEVLCFSGYRVDGNC